jgi:hypothetical protein
MVLRRALPSKMGQSGSTTAGLGGVIEPRRPLCGFTGPRIYVITRNLMTC